MYLWLSIDDSNLFVDSAKVVAPARKTMDAIIRVGLLRIENCARIINRLRVKAREKVE